MVMLSHFSAAKRKNNVCEIRCDWDVALASSLMLYIGFKNACNIYF